jgi:NAD(P)H-hydrate epimerase
MRLVTRDEMREFDRATIEDYGTPSLVLMERAGRGVMQAIHARHPVLSGLRCLVLAGGGNNGGDGLVVARSLRQHGGDVRVIMTAGAAELTPDARVNLERYEAMGGTIGFLESEPDWERLRSEAAHADMIIDALLGTGFRGPLRGPLIDVIEIINASGAEVVAVDVPSGLDADTGNVGVACVESDLTVTLGLAKVGCYVDPGRAYTGAIEVVDIGLAREAIDRVEERFRILDPDLAAALLPARQPGDHKGRFGRLLVVGGSAGLTGAVALAGSGAARAGGGLVTVAVPSSLQDALAAKLTEVMTLGLAETGRRSISVRAVDEILAAAERADAVALGPGMSREPETAELIRHLVGELKGPVVLDADGLNAFEGRLAEMAAIQARLVLTPHVVEMARLIGSDAKAVEAERLRLPARIATTTGHIVLLKGSPSVVAARGEATVLGHLGNPGMATAGAGDVLTGIILGLLGQGVTPYDAAALGMLVHARAGDRAAERLGVRGMLAGDILAETPETLRELAARREPELAVY